MFEVVIIKNDEKNETWDCLDEMQAECVFFRARMRKDIQYVEINEIIDLESFAT